MVVGAVVAILEHMVSRRKRRLADTVSAFAAHLGEAVDRPVDPLDQVMATDYADSRSRNNVSEPRSPAPPKAGVRMLPTRRCNGPVRRSANRRAICVRIGRPSGWIRFPFGVDNNAYIRKSTCSRLRISAIRAPKRADGLKKVSITISIAARRLSDAQAISVREFDISGRRLIDRVCHGRQYAVATHAAFRRTGDDRILIAHFQFFQRGAHVVINGRDPERSQERRVEQIRRAIHAK